MNPISGVLEGAAVLWPHNGMVAGFDPLLDQAILRAFDNIRDPMWSPGFGAGAESYAEAMPYVRMIYAKDGLMCPPFLDMLDAKLLPRIYGPCDRCLAQVQPVARLWIPAGGSIVQVDCCAACRDALPGVVWR